MPIIKVIEINKYFATKKDEAIFEYISRKNV